MKRSASKFQAANETEAEYHTTQKVKKSALIKSKRNSNGARDEDLVANNERVLIDLKEMSSRGDSKIENNANETSEVLKKQKSREQTNLKPSTSKSRIDQNTKELHFTDLLDRKYVPQNFLFRVNERSDIFNFVFKCIKNKRYDTLLISGNPGTGKTMTITHVLKKLEDSSLNCFNEYIDKAEIENTNFPSEIKTYKYNAMNYRNSSDIIFDIMADITCNDNMKNSKSSTSTRVCVDKLKLAIQSKNKNRLDIIFIDEIDNLFKRQSVGGEMLELLKIPKYLNSNIIIIGASNTIDLIINLNQEYKVSTEIKNIVFKPYTFDEIFSILKDRIYNTKGLESYGKVFDEMAVRFCSKKIFSLKGGDIRYVLEVIQKVYNQKHIDMNNATSVDLDDVSECKIVLSDIMKTFEELYGRNVELLINSMPQQQQMGLLALYLILTKRNSILITKGDILSTFNSIATTNFLPKMDLSTLEDILETYESYEFIRLKTKNKVLLIPGKSSKKTLDKKLSDEIIPIISADEIKSAFEQSDFFSRYFLV